MGRGQGFRGLPGRHNWLLTTPTQAQQVQGLGAARAAALSFPVKPDSLVSAYGRAPRRTPEQTSEAVQQELARVATLLADHASRDQDLQPEDLELIHEGVFRPVFGDQTLRRRDRRTGASYPVWSLDRHGEPQMHMEHGNQGSQLPKLIRRAFRDMHEGVDELEASNRAGEPITLQAVVRPAATIYAAIIAMHPWLDGNGRTAWLVMTHTLIRSGALAVATRPTMAGRLALGRAITRRAARDIEPLVGHLAETIKRSA